MKKKLLVIALMVVMAVFAFVIAASAVEIEGIHYTLYPAETGNTAMVNNENRSKCTLTIVNIPETVEYGGATYTVTKIDGSAFGDVNASSANKTIKEVTIPSTVAGIGAHAFRNCTSLEKVTSHASGGSFTITNAEFMYCSALKEVDMSKSTGLTSIGSNAFTYCTNLETVYLPKGLIYISGNAFSGLSKLKTVVFPTSNPQTLKEISGKQAFSSTGLKDVVLPYGLEKLGNNIFQYSTVETVVIPSTVTHVGEHCFNNAKSLKYVVIANTDVTNYNNAMFYESSIDLIFFAGSKSDAQTFAGRLSKASFTNFISYDEYLQNPTNTYKDTIVYGTRNCSTCENIIGNPEIRTPDLVSDICNVAECTACGAKTSEKLFDAPIVYLGFSKRIGGSGQICIGYQINEEAFEEYKNLTKKTITYGFVAYVPNANEAKDTLEPINSDLTLKNPDRTIFASAMGYHSFEFVIRGFDSEETRDIELIMCAYVSDGSEVSYLGINQETNTVSQTEYATLVTFNGFED